MKMLLTAIAFAQLAASCSPGDSVRTLASVASVESGLRPWMIHDNTTTKTFTPSSVAAAVSIAVRLINHERHSVDLGLMQINSSNLSKLYLTIPETFDPCRSIAAGSDVLREGYRTALRVAFSRYNTGTSDRGFTNGYVQRVVSASTGLPEILETEVATTKNIAAPARQIPPPPPMIAVDLLHGEKVEVFSGEVIDLLPVMPVQQVVQPPARSRMSAAVQGQAVD